MDKKRLEVIGIVLCLVLFSGLMIAQAPQQPPKPGPEQKRLGYFVGKWTSEADIKANPFMQTGKMTSTDDCQWFDGGFSVVCHAEGKSPMGPSKAIAILGYNMEDKVYTYYELNNGPMTMASVPKGTVQGDTWTYTDQAKMGGKAVSSRYTITELSPTSYSFKWEMQGDDGSWKTVMEGRSKKS